MQNHSPDSTELRSSVAFSDLNYKKKEKNSTWYQISKSSFTYASSSGESEKRQEIEI